MTFDYFFYVATLALGATVHEFAAMISLPFLDGVGKIHAYKVSGWGG